jgi:hypothetical protein
LDDDLLAEEAERTRLVRENASYADDEVLRRRVAIKAGTMARKRETV